MPDRLRIGRLDWAAVVLVAGLGALAPAIELTRRSLWLDEGASLSIAAQNGAALWHGISHDGGNMLVYYLILHAIISLFGDGLIALRLLSVIADGLTSGLVVLLALRLFADRRVATLAGVLSALSVGLIFWGQDARGYALMVTAATLAFYALVIILQSDPDRRPPAGAVAGFVFATALSLYIGFDAVLLLPAELASVVLLRRRRITLVCCLGVVLALCVPLIVLALDRGSDQLFWVPPLSGDVLWQTLVTLVSAGLPPNFHTTALTIIAAVLFTGLGALALLRAWRSRHGPGQAELLVVPVLWLALPALLGVLGSAAGEPLELARISILAMPALSLLLAWLLLGAWEGHTMAGAGTGPAGLARLGRSGLVGVMLITLALRLVVLVPSYGATPEPWKQAAARVLGAARPGDCIAFYPQDGRMPFGYYVQHTPGASARAPRPLLPRESWSSLAPHVEQYVGVPVGRLRSLTRGCARVWLVSSHQGQAHGTPVSRTHHRRLLGLQGELARLYPAAVTQVLGYAASVTVVRYSHG